MIVLDGKKAAEKVISNVAEEIRNKHLKMKVVVFLIGDSSVSMSYINKKREFCKNAGVNFNLKRYDSSISQEEFDKEVKMAAEDDEVSGIVIQLPLPKNFDTQKTLNIVPLNKDIDVLSADSFEKFSSGGSLSVPPVVGAVKYLLREYSISVDNKDIVLVGKGRLVGRPLSVWLESIKANFKVVDKSVKDISEFTKNADIVISGVGSPSIIKENMVKKGAVLIDIGTSSEEGEIKGDIDLLAYKKASYSAPVPGGIGPLAVAMLLDNLLKLNTK